MRKSLWIFLLAIVVPGAVLGYLALRSAEEQKIILEQRTAELYQRQTENLAAAARTVIDDQRRAFADTVRQLLAQKTAERLAADFTTELQAAWPRKAVGFSIADDGRLCSPSSRSAKNSTDLQKFLIENGAFLSNKSVAAVYTVPVDELTQPDVVRKLKSEYSKGSPEAAGNAKASRSSPQTQTASVGGNLGTIRSKKAEAAAEQRPSKEREEKAMPAPRSAAAPKPTRSVAQAQIVEPTAAAAPGSATAPSRSVVQEEAPVPSVPAAPMAPAPETSPADRSIAGQTTQPFQAKVQLAPTDAVHTTPEAPVPVPPEGVIEQAKGEAQRMRGQVMNDTWSVPGEKHVWDYPQQQQQLRNVSPVQVADTNDRAAWSALAPAAAEFRALVEESGEGILSRFVQDKLNVIFWLRPPQAPGYTFGCVIDPADLRDLWPAAMPTEGPKDFVMALLDDRARPVAMSSNNTSGRDWKRPFVASEIGEVLPHWEAALYLMRPEQLRESALGLRRTLTFLVVAMLGAIGLGGWLVVADARRQLELAQQKTDFVSNVSHELKTPLTSIRMFAELMLGGRPETQAKAPQYLRIIMVEAERLTRLINNVLDFAKLERRQKRFDKKPFDLHEMIERIWESHELHLQESGFTTKWQAETPPYPVVGDDDALAQVLVNLLSNAEKYSYERKEVDLQTYFDDHHVCVAVLDRGMGVPPGEEHKIFEAFYRAHDSLSSGIQGSGLGLTLAQRLAQEHGGCIEYRAREGGGSAFTLKLPLAKVPTPAYGTPPHA